MKSFCSVVSRLSTFGAFALAITGCTGGFNSSGFTSQNSPSASQTNPSPIPSPTPTSLHESAEGTVVLSPSDQITDGFGVVWTLTLSGKISRDGTVDNPTHSVTELVYHNHTVYQEAQTAWWDWSGGDQPDPESGISWLTASNPISSPNPSPTPTPTPVPTPTGTVMNHKGIQSFNPQPMFLSQADLNAMATRWQGIGVKWTRLTVDQGTNNSKCDASYNFTVIDNTIDTFAAHGIESLMDLGGGAACNSMNGGTWGQPTNPTNWAAYAGAVAAHEGARGHHYYEIWNEESAYWDWGNGSCCGYPDIAAYTKLLCAAYTQIHSHDAQAFVIIGGSGPGAASYQGVWNGADFLTGIYNNGGANCFDADAGHPYMSNGPNGSLLGSGSSWLTYTSGPGNVYAVLAAHGQANKPIWSTEIGCWNSPTDASGSCDQAHQAQFISDLYSNPASRLPVEGPIFYWEDHDAVGATCSTGQSVPSTYCAGIWNAGLTNYEPGSPKPAVTAYQNASGVW